jgi:hypothetical protein
MSQADDVSTADTLGVLQDKGDRYTKLALVERKRQQDLEEAISYIIKESENYRERAKKSAIDVMNIHVLTPNPAYQRADGVNIGKEAQIVTSKTLIVLEAKLNKLLQRKSEIQNNVKKLKESINHFRLMRTQTDDAHKRYEDTLQTTKHNIENILAQSTKVVEEREKLVEKKDALERLNLEEQQKFVDEYETMGKFVKEQNDALEFSLLQERKADRAGTTLAKPSDGNAQVTNNVVSDLSVQEEVEMAKKVNSLNSFMSQEQASLTELRDKIATYETMFEQLKKMTGVESLEEMVTSYIAHEEEMFSLYNFIQTVNTEIDNVLESTLETEQEITNFKADQQDQDQQRRSTLDELQQRLTSTLEVTSQLVDSNALQQESVSQISKKVSSVFFKLQCDQMDAKGSQASKSSRYGSSASGRQDGKIALLTGQGITESNVLDYLGCIEQRAVDIISEYLRVMNKDNMMATNLATSNSKLYQTLTSGIRSPTPGPATPMNWAKREPIVDVGDLADDDFMTGLDSFPLMNLNVHSMNLPSSFDPPQNNTNIGGGFGPGLPNSTNVDDSKPIDIGAFKSKLQKKLGLKDSGPSSTGLMLGSQSFKKS